MVNFFNFKFFFGLSLFISFFPLSLSSQTVSGQLTQLANKTIILKGFNGLAEYEISQTGINDKGEFSLKYNPSDKGMGYLVVADAKPFIVVLSGEDLVLQGETLVNTETIRIIKGQENKWFEQYGTQHHKRQNALSAWVWLEKLYNTDTLFTAQKNVKVNIAGEINRIKTEDADFLNSLPKNSYVHWFLPVRKLVSELATIAQYRPEEIPAAREALRNINYNDPRMLKSGLFKEALEGHVWFIENSSGAFDKVFQDLNVSIDIIIKQFKNDPTRLNQVTDFLFNLLEKRSLFTSSAYLANKMLADESCSLEGKLSSKLESYRAMKKGNTAPDILFNNLSMHNAKANGKTLKTLDNKLKLVVFAAGWCSHCQEVIPKMASNYKVWQNDGVEVVLITLDANEREYHDFTKNLPFITASELEKWEGQTVKNYHIFATPTLFVLDKDLKILYKPISIEDFNSWLEYVYKGVRSE